MRTWLLVAVAVILATSGPAIGVAARQATPTTAPNVPPSRQEHPDCPVRQVSAAGIVAILREPAPEDPDAIDPRGDAVPPAERTAVSDLVATWQLCLASGNVPSLFGLFTADGIRRLLGERSPFLGGPAGLRVAIESLSAIERLRDGRVAARVTVDPSGNGTAPPIALIAIVERSEDGIWRIDHLRVPEESVGAAGMGERDPGSAPRALLRHPIAPGPGVPVPAPGPTVPMRGSDLARTGIQFGPAPAHEPIERWRTPIGWHSDAQPVVGRGLVFFGGFSLGERIPLLEAVDASSGAVRWQTTAPVAWAEIPDSPALAGAILFAPVQAPVAGVLTVAAATGEPLWFAPFGFTSVTAPAVDADSVYVAGWAARNTWERTENDASGALFALDQRTGRERWRFLTSARFGPVSVGRNAVYVPSDRGLFAIDRATGRKRWQARFSPAVGDTVTVAGEMIVFAGSDITTGRSGVFALDPASGALRWRIDAPRTPGARTGCAAANGLMFVSSWDAPQDDPANGTPTLRAYDLVNGEERWVFQANGAASAHQGAGAGSVTSPAIVGDTVLFGVEIHVPAPGAAGNADGLYAVDTATGQLRWHASPATPIRSTPAVLDGTVYAMGGPRAPGGATGGNLLAFGVE
ncbi:MAG TPA: PQQ-binding-like beta-propeller repeat protein [Thermomicrobiales bacterium]|nr:PQQ-binding-like beta-propeller repeat protein [Thermomicrobiales bacterium]